MGSSSTPGTSASIICAVAVHTLDHALSQLHPTDQHQLLDLVRQWLKHQTHAKANRTNAETQDEVAAPSSTPTPMAAGDAVVKTMGGKNETE
jgi:hypothetical protein